MASDTNWTTLVKRVAGKMMESEGASTVVASTPRGHGKSMIADFLSTPGYSTEDAARYGSHDEYMKVLKRREAERKQAELAGPTIIQHGDFVDMEAKEDDDVKELQDLATEVTKFMKENPETFMLSEPVSLTIKRSDGQYSKRAHIGGEDFRPSHAYVGKRKSLIYVFKPVMVSDYAEMELYETEAKKMLTGFAEYIRGAAGGELERFMRESKKAAADAAERERLAGREEQYADLGFGSW